MKHLIKIIKGSLVGMASILPGVSGSMIAAVFNIYQMLVSALNKFTKTPFKAIASVWQYILGIIIGLFLGFFVIRLFLDIAPLPITLLFIGFILGAIPYMLKIIKETKTTFSHYATLVTAMMIMLSFLLIHEGNQGGGSLFVIFLIGLITSSALIIPGLSGATMLIALGFYEPLLDLIGNIISTGFALDFQNLLNYLPAFIILVVGTIVGLIFMGKVMFVVLNKYKKYFYMAVLGFVFISPINILYTLNESSTTPIFQMDWYFWVTGAALLVTGIFASLRISSYSEKMEEIT